MGIEAFLTIQHADPVLFDRFQKGFEALRLYGEFRPCPIPDRGMPNAPRGATLRKRSWCKENWGTAFDIGPYGDNVLKRAGKFRIELEISESMSRSRFLEFFSKLGFVISWEPLLDDADVFQRDRGTIDGSVPF